MTKSKRFMLVSTVLLFGGAVSAYADDQTSSAAGSSDTLITAAVKQAIAQHPALRAPNQIYVDTREQVVYLSGLVDNGLVAEDAEQAARQVRGVVGVVNTISVDR